MLSGLLNFGNVAAGLLFLFCDSVSFKGVIVALS